MIHKKEMKRTGQSVEELFDGSRLEKRDKQQLKSVHLTKSKR